MHGKVKCLLEWCTSVGIRIDPRLEIKENSDTGISVFSRGEYISNPTTRKSSLATKDPLRSHPKLTFANPSRLHSQTSCAICKVLFCIPTHNSHTVRAWCSSCTFSCCLHRDVSALSSHLDCLRIPGFHF